MEEQMTKKRLPEGSLELDKIVALLQRLLRPYASIYFCYTPWVGFWFFLLSLCSPRTACAGFFSLICTWVWGKLLSINLAGDLHLVNGLLCGLFLSSFYPLSTTLLVALALTTLFITISVNWLSLYMWYMGRIPLMTFPFVLGTWLIMMVFHQTNLTILPSSLYISGDLPDFMSWRWTNDFFSAVGELILVPYPLTGALVFLGLFLASRYLAFLAISGYIAGFVTLYFLGHNFLEVINGYNFMLVAMALGGIFMVPSIASYLIALAGSALTAFFVVALFKILDSFHLPILIMPFLLSTYFWLGGLGPRIDKNRGLLYLDFPVSPEIAWENARLNRARGVNIESTPLIKLFSGEWLVEVDSKTQNIFFSKEVATPEVDQLILSPFDALVLSVRQDFEKGQSSPWDLHLDAEWGDFLLLRDRLGQYVFLSKLKEDSIKPKPNDWVSMGQPLAACGKLSDQSKYCLYIRLQKGSRPVSDPIPYHLVNVLSYEKNKPRQFHLFYVPKKGDYVIESSRDDSIVSTLHLPPGLRRKYVVIDNHQKKSPAEIQTGMTPLGQCRLYAARDCSAAYELTPQSLVFYDRQGRSDTLLDLLMLGLGLTPLTSSADTWNDKPSVELWPLNPWKRLFLAIVRPLGLGCESTYTRRWDKNLNAWLQIAVHRARVMPGMIWEAKTSTIIDPARGVCYIKFEMFGETWQVAHENYELPQI